MSETILTQPDVEPVEAELAIVVKQADAIVIRDAPSHEAGLHYLAEVARREKFVKEMFAEPKAKAHAAHKAITALESRLLAPLSTARQLVSGRLTSYEQEAERKAAAERARLEAEARQREEEARIIDAANAEEAGEPEEAAAIMAEPVIAPVIHVAPAVAKVEGTSKATRYSAEVVDLKKLVLHVAARVTAGEDWWLSYLEPNGPNLNRAAVSQREALNIPGVKVVANIIRRVTG